MLHPLLKPLSLELYNFKKILPSNLNIFNIIKEVRDMKPSLKREGF
jgi:hypothetical protein